MPLMDEAYKDSAPLDTVRRIKQILRDNGLSATEVWQEDVIPNCHAMSVQLNGLTLKTNGKGLTREFAMASGYGELMERLQLGLTGSGEGQKTALREDADALTADAATLIAANPLRYQRIAQMLTGATGLSIDCRRLLSRFEDCDGDVTVKEYRNLVTGQVELLPTEMARRVYGTNGCAAGNTPEEALVQAISEIMERHHQLRIIHEGLTPPEFPESMLKNCAAWETICFLRQQGLEVSVRDCSLGTPFPVVCVCLTDPETGAYHTHFGAFPRFEIALQRALTETFQGRTLQTVTQFRGYSNKQPGQHHPEAIANEVAFGGWRKPRSFFHGSPSFPVQTKFGFDGGDNKTLLKQCVHYLTQLELEILVRDHSTLGFPTYQVIIPGFSEVMIHRLAQNLDDTRYSAAASQVLRDPAKAAIPDAMGLILHLQELDQLGQKIKQSQGFTGCARLSARLDRKSDQKLLIASLCHIQYSMGRRSDVVKGIDQLLTDATTDEAARLLCVKQYLNLLIAGRNSQAAKDVLHICHTGSTVAWLFDHLDKRSNPFDDFVIHCDELTCDGCPIQFQCCQVYTRKVSNLIARKTAQLNQEAAYGKLQDILQ